MGRVNLKISSLIYIILASILWGTSAIFFKLLTPFGFMPIHLTAMRGIVSAISIILYTLFINRNLFKASVKELVLFISSGVAVFLTAFFYYASIAHSSVSTAAMLMYTAPVFVVAYSVTFLGEKLTRLKLVSIVLVIVGCALVSGIINGVNFSGLGFVFGLASGIVYSSYNISARIAMLNKSNSLSATLYCFITMGILSLITGDVGSIAQITSANISAILPLIIGIGVCTCVMPYFLYTHALRHIPAGTASAIGILEPISATVFSVVFFNETLTLSEGLGIAFVLLAVFILSRTNEGE